jgi:hypothetical protein
MLLELLNHHEDLLTAAVGPLIGARKAADLAALGATCRQLRLFITAIPLYKHYKLFNDPLKNIKSINILNNEYISIKECSNSLHIYYYRSTQPWPQAYYIWSLKNHKKYCIEYGNNIKISEYDVRNTFYITIKGLIPTWISKYIELQLIDINVPQWIFYTV